MAEELKSRKEVPEKLTWDLSRIYATEADMLRDAEKMERLTSEIVEKYKGQLNTPEQIEECVTAYRQVYELMTLTASYCDLAVSVDYYDNYNQERYGRISRLNAKLGSSLRRSFRKPLPSATATGISCRISCGTSLTGCIRRRSGLSPH